MNKNFVALMASIGTQIEVPKMSEQKSKIVKQVSAGVLAIAMGFAGAAHAQTANVTIGPNGQPASHSGEVVKGAAIGGVAGWGLSQVFGANQHVKAAMMIGGAALGGKIAGDSAEARDQENARVAAAMAEKQSLIKQLDPDRAARMTKLEVDAVSKRLSYQIANRDAQEAKADQQLNPGDAAYDARYKRSAVAMMQANRQDQEAVQAFKSAFETLQAARFNVSAYAATYGKLSQRYDVNDQSYSKLVDQVMKHANVEVGAAPAPVAASPSGPSF